MDHPRFLAQALRLLAACVVTATLLMPAAAADAVFPIGSRLGLVPPPGIKTSQSFPGFEDQENNVFIRLVSLPGENPFADIERTMTNEALRKQGMTVEKRETLPLGSGKAILAIVRQDTGAGRIRKWLLITTIDNLTALVSVETPAAATLYTDAIIRATLQSLAARPHVPVDEQLAMVPFRLADTAGMRLVRVIPGVAAQFTDGPKDIAEATEQPHLVIAASPGGPSDSRDRDQFARDSMSGLPGAIKDVRIINSEPMRVGGQPGHEIRAQGKDAQTGADIEIVQWLRFGTGGFVRILGFAPKDKWPDTFTRFRALRDGIEPR
jgi:hypothetical protein